MCVRISLRWPLASLSLCLFIFLLAAKFYTLSLHDALPISLVAGHWSLAKAREPKTTNNQRPTTRDRKSTRLNSSHANISYAVFCLKKKKHKCDRIKPTGAPPGQHPPKQNATKRVGEHGHAG